MRKYLREAREQNNTIKCDLCDKDGNVCQFQGAINSMGQHKWISYGLCNPAKAPTITNECHACINLFTDLKSAKEHAYKA